MPIRLWGTIDINGNSKIGKFDLSKSEGKVFTLIKCRNKTSCQRCDENIPSKSYCLGSGYHKICLKCAEPFIKSFLSSLKDYEKMGDELLKDIKAKEPQMTKNNILAKVEDNG
jgi:hypothetical protein